MKLAKEFLEALNKIPIPLAFLLLGAFCLINAIFEFSRSPYVSVRTMPSDIALYSGGIILTVSILLYLFSRHIPNLIPMIRLPLEADINSDGKGLDLSLISEENGIMSTYVADCKISVVFGRIEQQHLDADTVVALPCNEYFNDECIHDHRSALGAYANKNFEGQIDELLKAISEHCSTSLVATDNNRPLMDTPYCFGPGRCILIKYPLKKLSPIALISSTTKTSGEGLQSKISYLFGGTNELFRQMADAKLKRVVMPILGAGHGNLSPPLALIGLLIAVAEAAKYGQGGQRPKQVTIVVFRSSETEEPEVDPVVIRRSLAIISSPTGG